MTEAPLAVRAAMALLPVLVFLGALFLLDTFRLVRPRRLYVALACGGAAALASYVVNTSLIDLTGLSTLRFALFVAPLVEETLKAGYVVWLVRTRRAGFLIDAAVLGFAVGAGFSLVENLYYLKNLATAPLLVWIIRGLGTAMMHGGTTAVAALIVQGFGERRGAGSGRPWLTALLTAALLHAAFNRFMVSPILATGVVLVALPLLLRLAYHLGEKRLRRWIGFGFDRDSELLALVRSGEVAGTPLGRYLRSLRDNFRADTVADMLCLLRLQCELSLRAKGTLLLREHAMNPVPDPELSAKLDEVRWLEHSIGRTGLLAMRPICHWHGADAWQKHLLEEQAVD